MTAQYERFIIKTTNRSLKNSRFHLINPQICIARFPLHALNVRCKYEIPTLCGSTKRPKLLQHNICPNNICPACFLASALVMKKTDANNVMNFREHLELQQHLILAITKQQTDQ